MRTNSIYIHDIARRIKYYTINKEMEEIEINCEKIDPIKDFDLFSDFVKNHIKTSTIYKQKRFTFWEYGNQGNSYGHRNALFEYAGYKKKNQKFLLPSIEHGITMYSDTEGDVNSNTVHSFVFQGAYRNEKYRVLRKYSPIINVGPYILYTESIYPDIKIQKIKEKNGKTLLIFPDHACENSEIKYSREQFVDGIMSAVSDKFDTLIACVYWNDVDDPIYRMLERHGVRLVSAGIREDPRFISRLRTIISLSDYTLGSGIGTHIGYCMAMGKPHKVINVNECLSHINLDEEGEKRRQKNKLDFYRAFKSFLPTQEEVQLQNKLYRQYWGGMEFHKSKKEMREIILLEDKLIKLSKGNVKKYYGIIKTIVENKFRDNSIFNERETELLKSFLT